jgi:hypothetical protein
MMNMAGIFSRRLVIPSVLLLTFLTAVPAAQAAPQSPVNLGGAGYFTILAKTGISTTGTTAIIGNIGVSPAAATYITGFDLSAHASNKYSISTHVNGKIYAANYAPPTPAIMTAAVGDMLTAYADAAGRTLPDKTELGTGNIGGLTLGPGLYKWGGNVSIPADVTISGSATDIWIFQIAGNLTISPAKAVKLIGGAQASNIFWQVGGLTGATLGTNAVFSGNILSLAQVIMDSGATLNGRALAQEQVTLIANTVSVPVVIVPSGSVGSNPTGSPNLGNNSGNLVVMSPGGYAGPNPPASTSKEAFAYPSPARTGVVNLVYNMTETGRASIRIWNENGDLVASLDEPKLSGPQTSRIAIGGFAPGIYLYKIILYYDSNTEQRLNVRKFVVAK